jgi:hypothetical protein
MNRNRNRWALRIGAVLVAGAIMLIWALRQQSPHELTVSNQSGQTIAVLKVTVAGQTHTFRDVVSSAEISVPGAVKSDEQFQMECEFPGSRLFRGRGVVGEQRRIALVQDATGNITLRIGDKS